MAQILVIDDEAPLRQNLARFLRMEGHQVMEAGDGQDGFAMAQAQRPALVFCDVMMPRMNGMQVLAALQGDDALRSVPFIFVSASAEPERLHEALGLGAKGYLTKPFSFEQLRQILQTHLAGNAAQGGL
ncbi:MAG: response regulator [Rhodoferax sp.]|nr:response regulator [Rhodoferax sp.]